MNEQISQIIREAITELIDDSRCVNCGSITNEDLRKWFGKGGAGGTTKGGWDRYGSDGQKLGKCGDGKEGGAYAACLSAEKARKLGKKVEHHSFVEKDEHRKKVVMLKKVNKEVKVRNQPIQRQVHNGNLTHTRGEIKEKGPLPTEDKDLQERFTCKTFKNGYNYGHIGLKTKQSVHIH